LVGAPEPVFVHATRRVRVILDVAPDTAPAVAPPQVIGWRICSQFFLCPISLRSAASLPPGGSAFAGVWRWFSCRPRRFAASRRQLNHLILNLAIMRALGFRISGH
jgi:hypothetical protein